MLALCLPNLGQAIELKGVLNTNRLSANESKHPKKVFVELSRRCGGETQELVLWYPDLTASAAKAIASQIDVVKPAFAPCDTRAIHALDGSLKLALSYAVPKGKTLEFQATSPNDQFVVDHWFGVRSLGKKAASRSQASEARVATGGFPVLIENLNDLAKIKDVQLRSFSNLDSPYRDLKVEKDLGLDSSPLKTRSLNVPLLQFKLRSTDVDFDPLEFPYKEFQIASPKMSSILKKSLNAILEMAKGNDWIRATAANDILLKSKIAKEYRSLGFFTPALDGYLKIRSSLNEDGTTDNRLFSGGINIWRETLLKQAVSREASDPFLDFMYLESLRYLYKEKDYYTGLAMIDEARGIKWKPRVLERSEYLEGVALLSLGMFQKAAASFGKYIEERKKLNIRDVSDRRLLPSAAFRLADVDFTRDNYQEALISYEKAMAYLPGSTKLNLEGYLYPKSLVSFPQVLFNMAEAHTRLGEYGKALKRLRALMAFDITGTNHGIAMFRIGEILKYLNSSPDRAVAIFQECSYRYSGYLSGRLCEINSVAMDPQYRQRSYWPRLEAIFATFEKFEETQSRINMGSVDRKMYAALMKARFYLDRNKPLVALSALDETRDLESSSYLKNWNFEFSATAFLGVLRGSLEEGDFKSVIKSYERRRKNLFLYLDRAGVLLSVAKAYSEQGLWSEASQSFERAKHVRDVTTPSAVRPYDFSDREWSYANAKISVGLYDEGRYDRLQVEASLKDLDDSHMPSLLLLIGFAQKSENLELEARAWQRLDSRYSLDWAQLKSYSSALLKLNRAKDLRSTLERHVGTWFYEKDKSRDVKSNIANPGSVLLMRLAEARVQSGALESGIRIFDYLSKVDSKELDSSTPKELLLYSMGKALVSKKDYAEARRTFDAATALAPQSVWGRLAATESQDLRSKAAQAQAR